MVSNRPNVQAPEIVVKLDYDFIIFGGAFNPVHVGHVAIIEHVLTKAVNLQKLFLVPTHRPAHKAALELSAEERLQALNKAIGGLSDQAKNKIEIIDYELKRSEISYSLHTIEHLQNTYSTTAKWGFVLGLDALQILPNWFQVERVVQLVDFVTFPRPSSETTTAPAAPEYSGLLVTLRDVYNKLSGRARLVGLAEPIPQVSSTVIRSLLKTWSQTKTTKTPINLGTSNIETELKKYLAPAVFEYFKNRP